MKNKWWHGLVLMVAMGSVNEQAVLAHSKLFSDYSFEQAKKHAYSQHKLLLLDFTAQWCGPCKKMDATTWSDTSVEDWIRKNAIAVQIDVDKEESLRNSLNVSSMPTILIFDLQKKNEVFDRQTGYKSAPELLAWLQSVKAGNNSMDLLSDSLAKVVGKGGPAEVAARYKAAKELVDAGRFSEATDQFVWLWANILKEDPAMLGVRSSFMASEMTKLAKLNPDAKKRFEELRATAETSKNREDWMVLNNVVGEDEKTLAWFDEVKNDAQQQAFLRRFDFMLEPILFAHRRWADLTDVIYQDPLKKLNDKFAFAKEVKQITHGEGESYDSFPRDAAKIYCCFLAAGRDSEAEKIASESLKLENTPAMYDALANMAFAVDHVQSIHLKWIDEAAPKTGKSAKFYYRRGDFCAKLKQYDEALKDYGEAIRIAPSAAVYRSRSKVYADIKQYDKSLADMNHAIALEPNTAADFRARGFVQFIAKNYKAALEDFERAVVIDPSDPYNLSDQSAAFFGAGKYQEAYDAASKAISLDPQNKPGFCNRGEASFKLGNYEAALSDLTKATEANEAKDRGEAYYFRAQVYEKLGKSDLAATDRKLSETLGFKPDETQ